MTQCTRYGFKIATDADQNEDPSRSTRITKGAEGKVMGMEREKKKIDGDLVRWEVERVGASCLCALCSRC